MALEPVKQSNIATDVVSDGGDQVRQPAPSERKLIEQWILLGNAFNIPKSVSQIYGLMFVTARALSANECVKKLKISRSSAGQGIKLLMELGAIKPTLEIGKRQESYVIEPDLGVLAKNLLQGRFMPTLNQFARSVPEIHALAEEEDNQQVKDRIAKLERWQSKLAPLKYLLEKQF